MTQREINSGNHHWWPTTLQRSWCDHDDNISIVRSSGEEFSAKPGSFGAINHAHSELRGTPWASTFEHIFTQSDDDITAFPEWLTKIDSKNISNHRPMVERIIPQTISKNEQQMLARITASLLARSPRVRYIIKSGNENFRRAQNWPDQTVDKSLVAANQKGLYDAYRRHMESSGRWGILFSDEKEFIAGDGFFHNFPTSQIYMHSGKKLILPILPTAAIIFMSPMSYPSEPKLVTLRLNSHEVETINKITQIYASDFIFFRNEKPNLTEDFKTGKYQEYEFHGDTWLDSLLDDLSQYNNWGENGAATISSKRYFTESLEGNRRFESLAQTKKRV